MSFHGQQPPNPFNFQAPAGNTNSGQRHPGFYDDGHAGQPTFGFTINPQQPGGYEMNVNLNWTQYYSTGCPHTSQTYVRMITTPSAQPPPPCAFTFPRPAPQPRSSSVTFAVDQIVSSFPRVCPPMMANFRPNIRPARLQVPHRSRIPVPVHFSGFTEGDEKDDDQGQGQGNLQPMS